MALTQAPSIDNLVLYFKRGGEQDYNFLKNGKWEPSLGAIMHIPPLTILGITPQFQFIIIKKANNIHMHTKQDGLS